MAREISRKLAPLTLALLVVACGKAGETPPRDAAPVLQFEGAGATAEADRLKHGERLARVLHCKACHGETLQGANASADDPELGDMNAPNVTLLLASYSDAQLEKLIRRGEPKDRRTFWYMASESFQFLGDRDLADLIAYLRTLRPAGKQMPPLRFGPGFYRAIKAGEMEPAPKLVARFARKGPIDLGPQYARGRWLARLVCTECHNSSLQGYSGFSPDLDIAGAYSPAELERLLTTGQGKTGRDLGEMAEAARTTLKHLTPAERAAIIAYLLARARHDTGG